MVFDESKPPDITESLPFPLTRGGVQAATAFPPSEKYDIAVGGLGFMLRPSAQYPYQRAGEQAQKQQFDTSQESGEQSLTSWWTRSQVSWHMGAGITWYEPGAEADTQYRFANSQGVDVWTQGEVTLLRDTTQVASGVSAYSLATCRRGGVDGFVTVAGTALTWRTASASTITATLPGVGTQPAVQGDTVWVGTSAGVSKWVTAGSGTLTSPITSSAPVRVWWVKSRLFAAVGPALYEVPPSGTGDIATAGELLFTHPDSSWVWVDVTETPDAVLAAGFSESRSAVFAFNLVDAGAATLPELSGARQVAELPLGEQLRCMGAYLGGYVVLGTTGGVRVGQVGQDGQVQYGRLSVETDQPVVDVTFRDRFAYCAVSSALPDGTSGVVRLDLSAPVGDTGTYAWAWDVSAKTVLPVTSVCMLGNTDRVVVAAGAGAVWQQSATVLVPSGWVESGRIRYRTTEPKNFRFARVSAVLGGGELDVTGVDSAGNEYRVVSYDAATGVDGEAAINLPGGGKSDRLAFRQYLRPNGAVSPVLAGFTVKALPAVTKARLYQLPLSCFDIETDRFGEKSGYEGSALHRVVEVEALEDDAGLVPVRDRRTGEAFVAVVESVEFSALSAPDRGRPNFGGTLVVRLRRM